MSGKQWIAWLADGQMRVKRYRPGTAVDAYVQGAERIHGPYEAHDRQKATEIAMEKLAGDDEEPGRR